MRIRLTAITLCAILVMAIAIRAQDKDRSVVLPQKAANEIRHLCSRPGPPKFDSTWQITEADVKNMEANLSRITQLKSASGIRGMRLEHPEAFYRQYVGIVVGKRKLIYINAFCEKSAGVDWHTSLISVCDGGSCFWGAVYDPATGEFSDLQMNGMA